MERPPKRWALVAEDVALQYHRHLAEVLQAHADVLRVPVGEEDGEAVPAVQEEGWDLAAISATSPFFGRNGCSNYKVL